MKSTRVALLLLLLPLTPFLAAGCGGAEETPGMAGKEVLDSLPPDPEIQRSPQSRRLKAEGPASFGGGAGPAGATEGMEVK